jgi:hypothetical protein
MSAKLRAATALIILMASARAGAQADNRQVRIEIGGTIAAQCDTSPFQVLVDNNVVHVTQYLRCNHPGRYVIRLDAESRSEWAGTVAKHKALQRLLDTGEAEFEVKAGTGATETFTIETKTSAAAAAIAKALRTQVTVR